MMPEEKRPVNVTWKTRDPAGGPALVTHEGTGVFHRWGEEYEEFETGPGNSTVAIVELPDGTVKAILPERVRFLADGEGPQVKLRRLITAIAVGCTEVKPEPVGESFHTIPDDLLALCWAVVNGEGN